MFLFLAGLVSCQNIYGATITATGNGNWNTPGIWSCNCVPGNDDNVIIPVGRSVTITGTKILLLGPVINITVAGELVLGNLSLDSNDVLIIEEGGRLRGSGFLNFVFSGIGVPVALGMGQTLPGPRTITNGTLPVALAYFKGEAYDDQVNLSWSSLTEKNVDYFTLARSRDGFNFDTLAQIAATGNAVTQQFYSYTDVAPFAGTSYYRLQATDFDGTLETFDLIAVQYTPTDRGPGIFPNPVSGGDHGPTLDFYCEEESEVVIYSSRGIIVCRQRVFPGVTDHRLNLPRGIGQGLYIVTVYTKAKTFRSTLVVQ